jgi:RNA polymerase sigma-70 factor (ECF subfamily)
METWYQQTVSRLYRFIYSLLQNREEAEDITQETYFRCLRKNAENLPPYPYLKQTARNLIKDRYRHWKITQDHTKSQLTSEDSTSEEDWINQTLVQEALNRLPVHYRQV